MPKLTVALEMRPINGEKALMKLLLPNRGAIDVPLDRQMAGRLFQWLGQWLDVLPHVVVPKTAQELVGPSVDEQVLR